MQKRYIAIIILILSIAVFGIYYVNDYYHADSEALKYLNASGNVSVSKVSNTLFVDGPSNDTALIFYPGAKVEYSSYLSFKNIVKVFPHKTFIIFSFFLSNSFTTVGINSLVFFIPSP